VLGLSGDSAPIFYAIADRLFLELEKSLADLKHVESWAYLASLWRATGE
jgi:hypothetical protein